MLSGRRLTTRHKRAQRAAATGARTVPTRPSPSPAPAPAGDSGLLRALGAGLASSPPRSPLRFPVLPLHRSWSPTLGATASLLSTTRGSSGSFALSDCREQPVLSFVRTRLVRLEGTRGVLAGDERVGPYTELGSRWLCHVRAPLSACGARRLPPHLHVVPRPPVPLHGVLVLTTPNWLPRLT